MKMKSDVKIPSAKFGVVDKPVNIFAITYTKPTIRNE